MAPFRAVAGWVRASGKRIAVSVVGFALVAIGLMLLVLPGPGLLVMVAGLAVLATEYAWARLALDAAKRRTRDVADRVRRR
jgi:uncharacterized protein (TIGR02611 family)